MEKVEIHEDYGLVSENREMTMNVMGDAVKAVVGINGYNATGLELIIEKVNDLCRLEMNPKEVSYLIDEYIVRNGLYGTRMFDIANEPNGCEGCSTNSMYESPSLAENAIEEDLLTYEVSYVVQAAGYQEAWSKIDEITEDAITNEATISNTFHIAVRR